MLKLLLMPLALVYRIAISIRNFCYEANFFKQQEFHLPIISVGNITVGGTGKTPHAEYLLRLLHGQFNVAYVSRGYKRKTKGYIRATPQSTAFEIGDEALQIARKFPEVPVAVCEKRVKGVEHLLKETNQNLDAIILDDAFQHRSIKPHINMLLIDFNRPIHEDKLLPVGRLREPIQARFRSNFIIVTKCPEKMSPIDQRIMRTRLEILPYQSLFFTTMAYGEIQPVSTVGAPISADELRSYSCLAFTGIAQPEPLLNYLKGTFASVEHLNFSDHHNFSVKDVSAIRSTFASIQNEKKILITTEKDLARLSAKTELLQQLETELYVIPIVVKFLDGNGEPFNRKILNYVAENKINSKLHQRKNQI
jgi:tetraacyldisaccharide 4'-kinase